MDQVKFDQQIANLVAHQTPHELARDLLLAQAQNAQIQKELDSFLFSKPEEPQSPAAAESEPSSTIDPVEPSDDGDGDFEFEDDPDADTENEELDDSDRP